MCTLTIHGLLHLAQGIRDCGPVWTTWTFFMERYCGLLQRNLHSRGRPWSNMNKNILYSIYREQLMLRYELQDELLASSNKPEADGPVGYERVVNGCSEFHHIDLLGPLTLFTDPEHILCPPYKMIHAMNPELRRKIAAYVTQVIGERLSETMRRLPTPTYHAGKVRIRNGGDCFQTEQLCRKSGTTVWRNCYVKVCRGGSR